MAGAISLSTSAALHTGAGLVTQAVPDRLLETVAHWNPCAMCLGLADDDQGRISLAAWDALAERFERTTCLACGPGLGRTEQLAKLVWRLFEECPLPIVLDADGLNNLADHRPEENDWPKARLAPRVLTPHPGEWARLSGVPASDTRGQEQAAVEFARRQAVVIVLKGYRTLVTDGLTVYRNATGTPAMATGGMGDVLTGMICALICQGLKPRDAAHLAVFAHGRAAQFAEEQLSTHVVLANQLLPYLSRGLRS